MNRPQRVHGIDNWRACLLLFGPIVHGSPSGTGHRVRWLELLSQSSHLFRMEAFFAIAGYLMMDLGGPERAGWLAGRMRQLLLPLLTVWLLLDIPTFAVLRWTGGPTISPADPLHLWFLLDLAGGTALICWLCWRNLLPSPAGRWRLWLAGWLVVASVSRVILYKLHSGSPMLNLVTGFPYYFCFAVAGATAARAPAARHWLRTTRLWWIGIPTLACSLGAFDLGYDILVDSVPGQHHALIRFGYLILGIFCAAGMTVTVLATALRSRHASPRLNELSRSAYTVYLVHMAAALLLARLFEAMGLGTTARFAAVVTLTLAASWAFHQLVVERSAMAALLFNGRALPRRSALAQTSHAGLTRNTIAKLVHRSDAATEALRPDEAMARIASGSRATGARPGAAAARLAETMNKAA